MKIFPHIISNKHSTGGFSLVEVLVAMLLIAVALVPALQALQSGVKAAKIDLTLTQETPTAKMEQLLARSFSSLALAAVSGGNAVGSSTVAIPAYDPSVALTNPAPVPIPPGPGFSDENYDVFIDCLDPATGATVASLGPCKNLLRIKVVAKDTPQQLVSYKAQ
jgi:prepilin-type N-terminal cleavage/methylation domain-containing protein